MTISEGMLEAIRQFLGDSEIDSEWLMRHINIELDDHSNTVVITIDNINHQEYQWIKEKGK